MKLKEMEELAWIRGQGMMSVKSFEMMRLVLKMVFLLAICSSQFRIHVNTKANILKSGNVLNFLFLIENILHCECVFLLHP